MAEFAGTLFRQDGAGRLWPWVAKETLKGFG